MGGEAAEAGKGRAGDLPRPVAGDGTRVAKLVAGTEVIGPENQRQLGAR